jgi:xanthine/uracil permease
MTQPFGTHPVEEVLPPARLALLGIQPVLVMYAGAVAVLLNLFFNRIKSLETAALESAEATAQSEA